MRDLVAQHHLRVDDLVAPLFVREGIDEPQPIASLPGVVQHTRTSLRAEVETLADLGVRAVILFGVPAAKDPSAVARTTPTASCRRRCATCATTSVTMSS
jgi:porphobilinogen synthase